MSRTLTVIFTRVGLACPSATTQTTGDTPRPNIIFIVLAYLLTAVGVLQAADRPDFIFISIDDFGYADIGPFGSKLNRTPHLDRMAQEGRKLTCFYAAPVCSPSRASLMTGCYLPALTPTP